MRGQGGKLCSVAVAALVLGQPALAQETGGLLLTFGLSERLETSENAALTSPSSGHLTASTTSLTFGLSSETRTQVLRLNLSGALRFEEGAAAADPDRFDNPSVDAFYSLTGANSALTLQGSASKSQLAQLAPTPDNPDPQGQGTLDQRALSAIIDLGTSAPLGLTLQAGDQRSTYSDATQTDTQTQSLSATGHLRFASGAEARIVASRSDYEEKDAANLTRKTTDLSLGWTQPLSPRLVLDASLGQQKVDTTVGALSDLTEGLSGGLGLTLETANGSAGLNFAQTQESGGQRQTLTASRSLDLGNQTLALSLGATRHDSDKPEAIASLAWAYDTGAGAISFDLGRSVAASGLGDQVTTDRLALGVSHDLGAAGRLNLNLSAARIDDSSSPLVERTDLSASYSRDLGQDWQVSLGASLSHRSEAGSPDATSRTIFLGLSRNFQWRP